MAQLFPVEVQLDHEGALEHIGFEVQVAVLAERLLRKVVITGQNAVCQSAAKGHFLGQVVAIAQTDGRTGLAELKVPKERRTDLVATAQLTQEIGDAEAELNLFPVGLPVAGLAEILSRDRAPTQRSEEEGKDEGTVPVL
jgi:hypothetical protein